MKKNMKWSETKLGTKKNHMTLREVVDKLFGVFQCDCGRKNKLKISGVFGMGSPRTCGDDTCPYFVAIRKAAREKTVAKLKGMKYKPRKKSAKGKIPAVKTKPQPMPVTDESSVFDGNPIVLNAKRHHLTLLSTDIIEGGNGHMIPSGHFKCDCGLEIDAPLWRFYSRRVNSQIRTCRADTCYFHMKEIESPVVSGVNAGNPLVFPPNATNHEKVVIMHLAKYGDYEIGKFLQLNTGTVKHYIMKHHGLLKGHKPAASKATPVTVSAPAPAAPAPVEVAPPPAKTGFTFPDHAANPKPMVFANPPTPMPIPTADQPTAVAPAPVRPGVTQHSVIVTETSGERPLPPILADHLIPIVRDAETGKWVAKVIAEESSKPDVTMPETLTPPDSPLPPLMSPQAAIEMQLRKLRGGPLPASEEAPIAAMPEGVTVVAASFDGWTLQASCPVTVSRQEGRIVITYQDLRLDLFPPVR